MPRLDTGAERGCVQGFGRDHGPTTSSENARSDRHMHPLTEMLVRGVTGPPERCIGHGFGSSIESLPIEFLGLRTRD